MICTRLMKFFKCIPRIFFHKIICPLQYYFYSCSFQAGKTVLIVALVVTLLATSFKLPLSFMFNQLEIRYCVYLFSAFLIVLMGNVRQGLLSQDLSFQISNYKLSLIFLLVYALLIEFGYISYIYAECGNLLIAISPESLAKYLASLIKPHELIPNYMMAGPSNNSDKPSAGSNPVSTGKESVNPSSLPSELDNPNLAAAKDLLEMLGSLDNTIQYQEIAQNNLKKFFIDIAKFTKDSKDLDSPLKAKTVKELGIYVRNWQLELEKAKKVHSVSINIINPAILSKKGITETVYNSLSKNGNDTLRNLEKYQYSFRPGGLYDMCFNAYEQAVAKKNK